MSVYFVILLSVLSSIAHRGSKVLVSLDALQLGANSFMVGVLAALYAVFPLLLAVYAGRISDRIGVRYPILFGSMGITAGLSLPALHEGLLTLFLCPALIGLGQIFFHVSIHNAVGSIGDPADRAKNFSTFSLGQSVATFIGPSLAGLTIDALGFRPTFVTLAVISLAVVLLALAFPRMVPPRGEHHDEKQKRRAFDLLKEAPLRRTLIMSGVALTGIELFSFYM
ncbi:MAG TPA: MFS transporter, partial [Burkholderiales bacterium]|nr:MFS transporter [Burkholderiales bacterium]